MNWLDSEKISIDNLHNYDISIVQKCLEYIEQYKVENGDLWFDNITKNIFSLQTSYANDPEAVFLATKDKFLESDKYGLEALKSKPYIDRQLFYADDDIIYSDEKMLTKYRDSKILIIGAGPSVLQSESEWKKNLEHYDFVWSCNHFFKPSFLKDIKFDLVTVGNEVDFSSKEFLDRLHYDDITVGIGTNVGRGGRAFMNFINSYKKSFFFSTRYFGKIGSIPRMLVLAQKLGVKHVSIVGMDGLPPPDKFNKSSAGVFEDKKPSDDPNSNYYNLYRKHYIMIWDHILNDLDKDKNITFHNYGKNYEFNMTKDIPESR